MVKQGTAVSQVELSLIGCNNIGVDMDKVYSSGNRVRKSLVEWRSGCSQMLCLLESIK